ncbi:LysR family transcriptional regulator [Pseudomonas monteilii]|uniref:DoxX family protein n=2 Tax=Pseudomonas TaxID=286 RepID=A0A6G6V6B8_9PSED|nr:MULTISPECIES: DoxX family protein [Pseudomonas]AVH36325.1 LysR family transcriptional regulator [Pseudomonas monteilii]MBA6135557.1 DoxX family protein [Pseudomonas monteilii]MBV4514210.1 DoxX family protein [Pseudomonas kurunegalensis]MBZ3662943.1 DoxX family protein [Pseudomonas monteilii]MBZ3668269.1 DoxX family protein [Pseudomonas monteilii]
MPRLKTFLDPQSPSLSATGLLFMRVMAALLLLFIHGLPKLLDWSGELQRIEDPFGLGAPLTLGLAVFAEVVCPLLLLLGVAARLACLPVLAVLLVALVVVHPDWTLEQGQFAWLLVALYGGLALTGPGAYSVSGYFCRGKKAPAI